MNFRVCELYLVEAVARRGEELTIVKTWDGISKMSFFFTYRFCFRMLSCWEESGFGAEASVSSPERSGVR